jgi:hypothetical protein
MTQISDKEFNENGVKFNATFIEIEIYNSDSCGVFTSCWKSSLFQSLQSTKSLKGFLKFLGEGSLSQGDPDDPNNTSCLLIRPNCFWIFSER